MSAAAELRRRALAWLARREHSRAELRRKLAPHASSPEDLDALLTELEAHNWLSDRRAAEQAIHRERAKYGSRRIGQKLKEQGIDEAVAGQALEQLAGTEEETARAVLRRKFPEPPADPRERAKQYRFLLQRGFASDLIRRVMRDRGAEESE